jgi:hypothetical protein
MLGGRGRQCFVVHEAGLRAAAESLPIA